ncbi:DUF4397 domain-containing protein [Runella zeae]|uniref:DUF4397 domain-containing protein n=1 Tax=Runella zeae TaxID=94255 RepID=UPI00041846E9|nr:DUF4397 domain-containing protein [Runella zeae]
MKSYKVFVYQLFAIACMAVAGCKEEERVGLQDAPDKAKVAIMNVATPNRPVPANSNQIMGYLFFLDNRQLYSQSLVTNKTTGYFLTDPGARSLRIDSTAAIINVAQARATVNTTNLSTEAGKYYSVFITGKIQAPDVVVTSDDLTRPEAGQAKVRVIHLSPDSPSLDIAGTVEPSPAALSVLFGGNTYKKTTEFKNISPGFYRLQLRETGSTTPISTVTTNNQTAPCFFCTGTATNEFTMNLEGGKIYTLVIRGYRNPATVGQIAGPLSVGGLINLNF